VFFFMIPVVAQASSPQPAATAPANQPLNVAWPARIEISPDSAANFARYNQGSGSMLVTVKCDGSKTPMIPPAPDIDGGLKSALMTFVSQTTVTAGASCHDQMFVIRFEVPSGNMTETAMPPPPG
jgi:hypothetical protein